MATLSNDHTLITVSTETTSLISHWLAKHSRSLQGEEFPPSSYHSAAPALGSIDVEQTAKPAAIETTAVKWAVGKIFWTLGVFLLAGLAEIGGGWLVWQTLRNKKPWYYFAGGAAALVAYGVIPTLQPEDVSFSRAYAVYGGISITLSYAWGWGVDSDRPDTGDWVGSGIALAGVGIALFWPR